MAAPYRSLSLAETLRFYCEKTVRCVHVVGNSDAVCLVQCSSIKLQKGSSYGQ